MPTGDRGALFGWLLAVSMVSVGSAQAGKPVVVDLDHLSDPVRLEQQIRSALASLPDGPGKGALPIAVRNGQVRAGEFRLAPGGRLAGNLLVLRGNAELSGRLGGNLVVLDGDLVLHEGGVVGGDALVIGGRIRERGGMIQGEQRSLDTMAKPRAATTGAVGTLLSRLAGLAGVLFTLTLLGFGMVLFAHPQLETISDTAANSVLRSFLTGLLAQVVVLPTVGILITGLVLSIVGILLVPFVLLVVPLLLIAAIVGGLLAVLHAMGETRVRRRMAAGVRTGSANSYRYFLLGLSTLAAMWVAWILFGWVPVAGALVFGAAFIATWLLATIGFGAALLSRGGIRPSFAGRYVPPEAMTDEYLWATPQFGVDAVKRPSGTKLPRDK